MRTEAKRKMGTPGRKIGGRDLKGWYMASDAKENLMLGITEAPQGKMLAKERRSVSEMAWILRGEISSMSEENRHAKRTVERLIRPLMT